MSIAELKETADKLTTSERTWLKAYLQAKERASDPEWKAEMARRRRQMQAGRGITEEDYRRRTRATPRRKPNVAK